jgi:hypothetical protein
MGIREFLRFGRGPRIVQKADPAIGEIAEEICRNLRELGLFVDRKNHGSGFCEIRASTSPKIITTPDGNEASGVALLLAGKFDPPALVFEQINSLERGLGRRMIGAVIAGLRAHPERLRRVKVNDLSPVQHDGRRWWEHVADSYPELDWRITHDADSTHWPGMDGRSESRPDLAQSLDFIAKREKLAALMRDFGQDPGKAVLSAEPKTFEFLGQNFSSEGEATPDGRITIYYDPKMSDARLGCCLAHEIQHLRYFALRDAYRAEPADGRLHRRFARFTPELLAAQRGVSNYSNEHWDAWRGAALPRLFSDELAEGGSEPVNETIAEAAKAIYNWGPKVAINPIWKELLLAIDEEYGRL